jgi:hypothetical protein
MIFTSCGKKILARRLLIILLAPGKFFIKTFFFLFYKENFPGSEKKNFILKKLPGDCNNY